MYRLTIFEILSKFKDLKANKLNGVSIYTILPVNRSDTDLNGNKSDDEHEENRRCYFSKISYFKGTSIIMEKNKQQRHRVVEKISFQRNN